MSGKKPAEPSPASISRANRQRLAQEEGVRAMVDAEKRSIELRANMQRLRALREAREAEVGSDPAALLSPDKKKRKKRIVK